MKPTHLHFLKGYSSDWVTPEFPPIVLNVNARTYSPSCIGFSRTRMYLKSGRCSGSSLKQSWMQRITNSGHLSLDVSGRNGQPPTGNFTRSTISGNETTKTGKWAVCFDRHTENYIVHTPVDLFKAFCASLHQSYSKVNSRTIHQSPFRASNCTQFLSRFNQVSNSIHISFQLLRSVLLRVVITGF